MKRAILIITAILLNINMLFAQHSISGTLVDAATNEGLAFANVGLIRATDTVYISGTASNEKGFFKFENIRNNQYILQVTAIGYENIKQVLDVTENIDLGIIKMYEGAVKLDEVVITEKKPLFANEGEKTLYNVSEDPSIQTGTASDALQNAPGVEVDVEGNITLRGVSSVEIWINGKPSHLNDENLKTYIQQLPANAIKTIEVITNPSARYASKSDGGIINIVTNSKVQKNQFVSFGVNVSTRPDVSPWVSYVYANDKISFNLYLNGHYNNNINNTNGYSYSFKDSELNPGILDTTTTTRYEGRSKSNSFGGGGYLSFQYNIDTMNNVSVWMGGWPSWNFSDSWQDYYRNEYNASGIEHNYYRTESDGTGRWGGFNGGADYQHLFNNKGHNIRFSFYGGYWSGYNNSTNKRNYYFWDPAANAFNDSIIRFTGYKQRYHYDDFNYDISVDYNLPYSDNGEINLGVSYAHAPDTYHNIYDTLVDATTYTQDSYRTLDRISWENELDAYLTLQHKFGNFVVKPGIRMEYSNVHCNMDGYMIDHQTKSYLNWRPSIHLSYRTKSMHNFKLSYTRRISNPDSRYLTNFVEYELESLDLGNIDLNPVYTNSIDAGWTKYFEKFGSVGLSAYYKGTKGSINNVTENVYDDVIFHRWVRASKPYNVDDAYNLGFEANMMYRPNGFFNIRLYANLYDSYYSTTFNDKKVESDLWSYSLRLNLWTKLWNKLEVHASGYYRSATQSLYAEQKPSYAINCGLRADFFNKKMSVYLNANDIFNWNKWDNNTYNPYYISYSSYKFNSRSVSIGVLFRFGKMELEGMARQGGDDDGGSGMTGGK
ncbi:MAG: TonB-dependent receptor [Bacteroidales bacterium]|nr:TonB-dependent receptor [Bacteroidales bacterium]